MIIGLSGKIASGKSTIAHLLASRPEVSPAEVVPFSKELRKEVDSIIHIITLTARQDDGKKLALAAAHDYATASAPKDAVESVVDCLHDPVVNGEVTSSKQRTPEVRRALQLWGTEVRRAQNEQYWVDAFLDSAFKSQVSTVCDDVRFPNEAKAILAQGFPVVRIEVPESVRTERLRGRDGVRVDLASQHASETSLDDFDAFTYVHHVQPSETPQDTASSIVEELKKKGFSLPARVTSVEL